VVIACLAVASAILEAIDPFVEVRSGSAMYLVAVVVSAYLGGTIAAVAAAIGAPLLYNFLFIEPRFTFSIADPELVLNVALLLFVGIVVGQLAALQRSRAEMANAREQEARALFRISRALATRTSTRGVLAEIVAILRSQAGMSRVWIALGEDEASEAPVADSGDGSPNLPGVIHVLHRTPGEQPARWVRIHQRTARTATRSGLDGFRVRIESDGIVRGSVWATRPQGLGLPGRTETRLLSAAADQIGQAIAHDRFAAEAQSAEVARRSESLQTALLQSVSHDLRTPLAAIRAAAGGLRAASRLPEPDREASVDTIERNVAHLNRLVTNLLDLSRIEAGALRVDRDAIELEDIVARVLQRESSRSAGRRVDTDLVGPPVAADPVLLDAVVTNILNNAFEHTPPSAPIRIAVGAGEDGFARLTVEDGGPGVPDETLGQLFDRFYQVAPGAGAARPGTGVGLAVARGFTEAMGGRIRARRADLGGLAVDVELPKAALDMAEGVEPGAGTSARGAAGSR
jgi:two-component system sensor histidine kinase KdpD